MGPSFPHTARKRGRSSRASRQVSILICNYNYARFLSAAIESALAQSHPAVEVVVVDDGSTDDSRRIINAYGSQVVPLFKTNGGQPSAINAGARLCQGEIVCLLDADDVFLSQKCARVAEAFARAPQAGWVFHELDYIDAYGQPIPLERLPDSRDADTVRARRATFAPEAELDLRADLSAGRRHAYRSPALSGLSFRREALSRILPIPEGVGRASDEFPKHAAMGLFPGFHLGEALALQRLHGANAATSRLDLTREAERYVKVNYYLRERCPEMGATTDRWFAAAFGGLLGGTSPREVLAVPEARGYFSRHLRGGRLVRQVPRIAFHALRARLRRGRAPVTRQGVSARTPESIQ